MGATYLFSVYNFQMSFDQIAKSLQSCLTLWDPIDGSLPGSPIPGILQARTWSGLPHPSPMHEREKWKWSRSVVSDLATLWTAAHQAPPSMGFSRQKYQSGVPLPSPKGYKLFIKTSRSQQCDSSLFLQPHLLTSISFIFKRLSWISPGPSPSVVWWNQDHCVLISHFLRWKSVFLTHPCPSCGASWTWQLS